MVIITCNSLLDMILSPIHSPKQFPLSDSILQGTAEASGRRAPIKRSTGKSNRRTKNQAHSIRITIWTEGTV